MIRNFISRIIEIQNQGVSTERFLGDCRYENCQSKEFPIEEKRQERKVGRAVEGSLPTE